MTKRVCGPSQRRGSSDSRSLSPHNRGRLHSPLPEPPSRPSSSPYKPALIFALTYCVGHTVTVQTRDGDYYEGILHTPGLEKAEVHIVLKKARDLNKEGIQGDFLDRLIIQSCDILQLHAKDLPIQEQSAPTAGQIMSFHMNADIDSTIQFGDFDDLGFIGDRDKERPGAGLYGRTLTKWVPDEEGSTSLTDFEECDHQVGTWDQFAENEKKFGVKTDFNMDLYTTRLDPEKSKYTMAEADKLAREIQSASSPNLHLQEERGQPLLDDSGVTEEDLYSSVNPQEESKPPLSPKKADAKSASPEPFKKAPIPLILNKRGRRPMIINPPPNPDAGYRETARQVLSAKPVPSGSPLSTSPYINDAGTMIALNLTSSGRKQLLPEDRAEFKSFKTAKAQQERDMMRDKGKTRREEVENFRAFSQQMDSVIARRTPKGSDSSPFSKSTPTPVSSREGGLSRQLELGGAFGSQILRDEEGDGKEENTNLELVAQPDLPRVKVERDSDGEDGDQESGRGLNPHATPFNPGHYSQTQSDNLRLTTVPDGDSSPRVDSVEKPEVFDLEPVRIEPQPMHAPAPPPGPPPGHRSQVLIRPQSVTPPVNAPPPVVQLPEVHPSMVMPQQMIHQHQGHNGRQKGGNPSPGPRRPPMTEQLQPQMVPAPIILQGPQSGPPPQSGGPQHKGQPQQMVPMMPHMTGAMHVMPHPMPGYPYSAEMAGRVPIMYPYPPGAMPPVPGPPGAPPGQQNNPEQGIPQHYVYPYYHPSIYQPQMAYGPMMQHGMPPPQYFHQLQNQMPRPPGASGGQRPRPNRGKRGFLNYASRRG